MHAIFIAVQSDPFTAVAIVALVSICFYMERRRSFRQGWIARGHDAAAHTLAEQRRKTSIRI